MSRTSALDSSNHAVSPVSSTTGSAANVTGAPTWCGDPPPGLGSTAVHRLPELWCTAVSRSDAGWFPDRHRVFRTCDDGLIDARYWPVGGGGAIRWCRLPPTVSMRGCHD